MFFSLTRSGPASAVASGSDGEFFTSFHWVFFFWCRFGLHLFHQSVASIMSQLCSSFELLDFRLSSFCSFPAAAVGVNHGLLEVIFVFSRYLLATYIDKGWRLYIAISTASFACQGAQFVHVPPCSTGLEVHYRRCWRLLLHLFYALLLSAFPLFLIHVIVFIMMPSELPALIF